MFYILCFLKFVSGVVSHNNSLHNIFLILFGLDTGLRDHSNHSNYCANSTYTNLVYRFLCSCVFPFQDVFSTFLKFINFTIMIKFGVFDQLQNVV